MAKLSRRNFLGVLAVPAALGAAAAPADAAAAVVQAGSSEEDFWRQLRQQFIIPANGIRLWQICQSQYDYKG